MAIDWIKFKNLFVSNRYEAICPVCGSKSIKQAVNYQGDKLYRYDTYIGLEKPVIQCRECEYQFVKPTDYSRYGKVSEFYGKTTPRKIKSKSVKRRTKQRIL